MVGNTTGTLFRVTTWGESHGEAIGVVIDGCPPRVPLREEDIQRELDRRRPGQSALTTPRDEKDKVAILSGVFEGKTTGAPICLLVRNEDMRPQDYDALKGAYRPSHSDFTWEAKYGVRDPRGSGRASARITIGRVAAGAIARRILADEGVEIVAYVARVNDVEGRVDEERLSRDEIERSVVRCPDAEASARMEALIARARDEGDSLGGVVGCIARGVPVGLGEPEFDKLDADLAKACMSIPATKGFEIGSGFAGTAMRGSEHNDPFTVREGKVATETNRSGGVQGGLSNGMPITLRVAFKPTSTIAKEQKTVDTQLRETRIEGKGRHDPCVLPRAVPIVEASVALVLCDHLLRHRAQCGGRGGGR